MLLGARCVATVDPVAADATARDVDAVDAGAYDVVILATPNAVKREYLGRFLAAGKSVLVEKPLPLEGPDDARALAAAAHGGAVWYTAYNHRFEPLLARLKARLDEGAVGKVDRARLLYGNGTVRDWVGAWRESGAGVLEDLGCHLLDLAGWLFGEAEVRWTLWDARPVESATWDYALFSSADRRLVLECGSVFWKNRFEIDVYGATGSLHLAGLNKWGGATLTHHARVLPSGRPHETVESTSGEDVSWRADLAEFERRVTARESGADHDARIAVALADLTRQATSRCATAPPGRDRALEPGSPRGRSPFATEPGGHVGAPHDR
jgi:predicted dehydrogenase